MICIVNFKTQMSYLLQKQWLKDAAEQYRDFDLWLAPTLPELNNYAGVQIVSQNISVTERTVGEISGDILNHLGIQYSIIGHLERRQLLNESTAIINCRLNSCFKHGITPIICLGVHSGPDLVLREFKSIIKKTSLINRDIVVVYESLQSTKLGYSTYSGVEMEAVYMMLHQYLEDLKISGNGPRTFKLIMGGHVDEEGIKLANKIGYDGVLIGDRYQNIDEFKVITEAIAL